MPSPNSHQCVEMQAVPPGLKHYCEGSMNGSGRRSGSGAFLNVAGLMMASRKMMLPNFRHAALVSK